MQAQHFDTGKDKAPCSPSKGRKFIFTEGQNEHFEFSSILPDTLLWDG